MTDSDSVRQRIIASVFSRRNANGAAEESYVSHVKIWEDSGAEAEGLKPRYILLSQDIGGNSFIHKSKLNSNGSFSVGKTWRLAELRGLEVTTPQSFNITLARTYRWQTENTDDQANFLAALVRLFRTLFGNGAPLQLIGIAEPNATGSRSRVQTDQARNGRTTPTSDSSRPSKRIQHATKPSQDRLGYDEAIGAQTNGRRRQSPASSRPSSPGAPTDRRRPASPMSDIARPPRAPRPSISNRQSDASQVPSINYPSSPPPRGSVATTSSTFSVQSSVISSQNQTSSRFPDPPSSATSFASSTATLLSTASTTKRPIISTTASSSHSRDTTRRPSPAPPETLPPRRDQNARVSFFDPANQAALDRMVTGDAATTGAELEEESTQATMASVEEMLEGYEWASDTVLGNSKARGAVDQIEARLLDELMALDKANIHSFIESDDRVNLVLKYLDEAILELDGMDSLVSSYKIHLNAVNDDISFIQSQNRGLQVQTQNQRALLNELEQLLQTVQVDRDALVTLSQESLEKPNSIQRMEEASTQLYKALQAGRDRDMAATMERLDEYRTYNAQFCKRVHDYLSIIFTAQSKMLLGDSNGLTVKSRSRVAIKNHQDMETYLGRYSGLILYLKEMDEGVYARLCAAYFSAASELHSTQFSALLSTYSTLVKKLTEEESEQNFAVTPSANSSRTTGPLRRAGTLVRSPLDGRKDKDKPVDGDMLASEAFGRILEQISPQVYREHEFIADFLQINDAALTFADYMGLENYFRRQASRSTGLSQQTTKLVRGAMELIFGFLPTELKSWIDAALAKDSLQVIGITACLERFLSEADERGTAFFINLLDKQHTRLKALFERHVATQVKAVEDTKLTSKKRNGVAPFIKYFPVYVGRVETQLIGADTLEIRQSVDVAYDKIVQTMFDSLKQMAKLDGEGEDKGQLNYHVILIENMHYFVAEIRQQEIGSVGVFSKRAENVYDENLNAYVRLVLRRPFAKIIDYFEGVDRLLKTTAPSEVPNNSSYNKSALKKVVKEFDGKDVRKHVDALFKRVEKHFTEASEKTTTGETSGIAPGTVMVGVWKACEEELLRITDLFNKRIAQCYANTGVSLEYTAADVEAAFKRHRIGS
ncbi:exocyst complex component Sec3-domain-containing protein [Amylostereum chailletii]|nr:exocyst complex component Sec3-domain-containing protein [Amylostereum chailletii]